MAVALVVTEHAAEGQQKEQREEQQMTTADQEHRRCEKQSVHGEAHQTPRSDVRCSWRPTGGTSAHSDMRVGTRFIQVLHEIEVWEWHANRVSVPPLCEANSVVQQLDE